MTTMPSARRVARKSVALLTELGMSKPDAARVVQLVCDEAAMVMRRRDPGLDMTWLADIASEAYVITQASGVRALQAVAEYQQGVARWAADFDQGHSAQRLPVRQWWPDSRA
jgi:hypothetical protein